MTSRNAKVRSRSLHAHSQIVKYSSIYTVAIVPNLTVTVIIVHSPLRNCVDGSDSQETPRSMVWSSGVVEFRHSSPPLVFNEQL